MLQLSYIINVVLFMCMQEECRLSVYTNYIFNEYDAISDNRNVNLQSFVSYIKSFTFLSCSLL